MARRVLGIPAAVALIGALTALPARAHHSFAAEFDAAKPVYGPRAVAGGLGNDPVMTCDPLGMPRNLFLEVSIYPMEILETPKRMLEFFVENLVMKPPMPITTNAPQGAR